MPSAVYKIGKGRGTELERAKTAREVYEDDDGEENYDDDDDDAPQLVAIATSSS